MLNWRKAAFPLVVVGSNALVAHMSGPFIDFGGIAGSFVGGLELVTPFWYPLIFAGAGFLAHWLMLLWMYRTRTFVKL